MVTAAQAHAADIEPMGVGDLMPSPDFKVPEGQGTLYETYGNGSLYILDEQFGMFDGFEATFHGIADLFMTLTVVIGSAAVVVVQWIFQLTSIPALENAITKSIGGAAKGLTVTLLPAALAVGGLVAFAQHKKGGGGGGLSQIGWVLVSGVFSISLLTSPGAWVDGIDTVRQVGASVTMQATSAGLGDGKAEFPFETHHDPKFTGNGRDDMLRKSSDSVWRAYVVTPWCAANFGSLEACEKYGADLLDQGTDRDKREEWLKTHVSDSTVGKDSVAWRQGHNPGGRVAVTIPAFINVVLFAALVIALSFASLASFLGALMLLLVGVIFACLWVIPGRPREWGLAWFDQLLGRTLESTIATVVVGAVLSIQVACNQVFGEYGWLPSSGLAIAAAIVGMQFRAVVAQIFGVRGTSGGMMAGFAASRLLNFGGGKGGGRRDTGVNHRPVATRPGGGKGGGGGGGGGGGWKPLPPGPWSHMPQNGPWNTTITRVPNQRPPAPKPLTTTGAGSGSGPSALPPATAVSSTPATAGTATATLTRTDTAPTPSVPAQSPPRPALPAATGAPTPTNRALPPGPTMRPEAGSPAYAFRQALPPSSSTAGPKVIQGTVIRSTPNPPPPRPNRTTTPPPPRTTAPPTRAPRPSAGPTSTKPTPKKKG
ncbi:hypothetical protein [Streptomyces sp. YIM 132580]|uniref:hypothetical protein n=1 Tax=Streptomyces sp. YIM 132580 TaxID=2691958 RepID=UPI0013682539|nr:hypothetical protein [Streptomyces sp. YIM 132580]MXG30378.1 hypothetical protein [Streptomyces sp. YIM 132580]